MKEKNISSNDSFQNYLDTRFNNPRRVKVRERKKLPKGVMIILIDIVLIVLVVSYLRNKSGEDFYISKTVTQDGIQFRLSMGFLKESDKYIVSLTIKNGKENKAPFLIRDKAATIALFHNKIKIEELILTPNQKGIVLKPGEMKTILSTLDETPILMYIAQYPEHTAANRKDIISFLISKPHIALDTRVTIYAAKDISMDLILKYPVSK